MQNTRVVVGRFTIGLLLLALLVAGWLAADAGRRERATRALLEETREASRAREDADRRLQAGANSRLDSLLARGDSLLAEIDGLRMDSRKRTDSLQARAAALRRSLDSMQALAGIPVTDTVAGPDTCCPKAATLLAGFMAAQQEIGRLRAEHDVRILYLLDAYATVRICAADTGAACSEFRRRVIAAFDSAATRAGWDDLYCKVDRAVFATEAVNACASVKHIRERWGLGLEASYLLGRTLTPDPCSLPKEEMVALVRDCVVRYRADTLVGSDEVRAFARPIVTPAFLKELRQRLAR